MERVVCRGQRDTRVERGYDGKGRAGMTESRTRRLTG